MGAVQREEGSVRGKLTTAAEEVGTCVARLLTTDSLTSYKDSCTLNHRYYTSHMWSVHSASVAPPHLTPLTATDSADGASPAAAIAGPHNSPRHDHGHQAPSGAAAVNVNVTVVCVGGECSCVKCS